MMSRAAKQRRVVNFHARFTPTGPDPEDARLFREFWLAAQNEIHKLQSKDLARRKERLSDLQAAKRKADPILVKMLRNQMPTAEASQKFRRLVPDKELAQQILDGWDKALKTT